MWTEFTIPQKGNSLDQCNRYVGTAEDNTTTTTTQPQFNDTCNANNFNTNQQEKCRTDNFIFRDKEVTISNDVSIKVNMLNKVLKSTICLNIEPNLY